MRWYVMSVYNGELRVLKRFWRRKAAMRMLAGLRSYQGDLRDLQWGYLVVPLSVMVRAELMQRLEPAIWSFLWLSRAQAQAHRPVTNIKSDLF